jgi:hypothetical protein
MGWSYETATRELPGTVGSDPLRRYNFIGARLDRLHKVLFGVTYKDEQHSRGWSVARWQGRQFAVLWERPEPFPLHELQHHVWRPIERPRKSGGTVITLPLTTYSVG